MFFDGAGGEEKKVIGGEGGRKTFSLGEVELYVVAENHDSCFGKMWLHSGVLLDGDASHGWDCATCAGFVELLVLFFVDDFVDVVI